MFKLTGCEFIVKYLCVITEWPSQQSILWGSGGRHAGLWPLALYRAAVRAHQLCPRHQPCRQVTIYHSTPQQVGFLRYWKNKSVSSISSEECEFFAFAVVNLYQHVKLSVDCLLPWLQNSYSEHKRRELLHPVDPDRRRHHRHASDLWGHRPGQCSRGILGNVYAHSVVVSSRKERYIPLKYIAVIFSDSGKKIERCNIYQ